MFNFTKKNKTVKTVETIRYTTNATITPGFKLDDAKIR